MLVANSRPTLFATPGTITPQAPLSMGFSKQEYWSGLSFPSRGRLPDPGIEPVSPVWAGRFFFTEPPGKPQCVSGTKAELGVPFPKRMRTLQMV